MQGQRNSAELIPGPLRIDSGSNSDSDGMDQSFCGSNMVLNSMETPTFADYLLSPADTDMDYLNMASRETEGLNIWNLHNHVNHDATKMDHGWSTSLSINFVGGPTMEGRHCEQNNILSLEPVDLNLNNSPVDDGQAFTQWLNSNHVNQRMEQNVHAGPHGQIMEVSSYPFLPEFFEPEHVPYSSSNGSSSSGVGQVSEDVGRAVSSIVGQRIACKRKNMEGVIGESSTSCNILAEWGMPSSSKYLPAASFSEVNQSSGFSAMARGGYSKWNLISDSSGNAESSHRNFRARRNSSYQHGGSPLQSRSALSSIWSSGDPSAILNPFNQSANQSQPHMLLGPGLPQNINNSSFNSSIGSSSLPAYTQRRLNASPEEANIRSLPKNGIVDQPTFPTRNNINQLGHDPPNWNPSNSSLSVARNRASSSLGVIHSPGSSKTPSEMIPEQNNRNFSEVLCSSLFPSSVSESGRQSNSLSSLQSGHFASMQEPGQSLRTIREVYSPLHPKAAVSIDRQRDGVSDLPLSARGRDGRNRMMSEIRNALDSVRRGMNLRFESGFYGGADLHDRHRDMRLDVENMSYEELLALEERIGYVNTGLNEETILKSLRQNKYSPCNLEVASNEQEPCCICREGYSEGEDIGSLDCKHDFHTVCIKQWLMIKNLCPICKTTGLVS